MPGLFVSSLNRTVLVLVLATAATFWMRTDDLVGLGVGVGTLTIAYLKGRLVILDFMGLRDAQLLWRGLVEGWLLLVSALMLLLYCLGRSGAIV
jgi:Prokaryotic Cytochrome C oxidase subunit IV